MIFFQSSEQYLYDMIKKNQQKKNSWTYWKIMISTFCTQFQSEE